ncbi:MAG: hypothetical protein GY869_10170, partial [Planctomycetes bacterium]|nr:hypothetical protein [Planctomycetota bacterium]
MTAAVDFTGFLDAYGWQLSGAIDVVLSHLGFVVNKGTDIVWAKSNNPRDTVKGLSWGGDVAEIDRAVKGPWIIGDIADTHLTLDWAKAVPRDKTNSIVTGLMSDMDVLYLTPWAKTALVDACSQVPWADSKPTDIKASIVWLNSIPRDKQTIGTWAAAIPIDYSREMTWAKSIFLPVTEVIPWAKAVPVDVMIFVPSGPIPPPDPDNPPWTGWPPPWFTVPWLAAPRAIMTTQNVILEVMGGPADGQKISLQSVRVSTDIDSWLWSFAGVLSLATDKQYLEAINFEPVLVELTISEYVWRFNITDVSATLAYGALTYNITGSSQSVVLGPKYQPKNTQIWTSATTMEQI